MSLSESSFQTCCNYAQAQALSNSLKLMEDMLGKCPTCMRNIRVPFCYMTCSPYQQEFLQPLKYKDATEPSKKSKLQ